MIEFDPAQIIEQMNNPPMISLSVKGFITPRKTGLVMQPNFESELLKNVLEEENKVPYELYSNPYLIVVPVTSIREAGQITIEIPELTKINQFCYVRYHGKKLILDENLEFFLCRIGWKFV